MSNTTNPELAIKALAWMRWDWRVVEDVAAHKIVFEATKRTDDGKMLRVTHEQPLGQDDRGYYHPMTKLAMKAEAKAREVK